MIPIIAHPERYDCIQYDPNIAYELRRSHVLLQMNKGSILGRYGRKVERTCYDLLIRDCYKFIGSDAHHPKSRSSLMYDAYSYMNHHYDENYVEDLFVNNPKQMLENIDIRKDIINGEDN